ncbi:MAG TPA: undecaprenyl-phosphate glucose phosphotransferase [Sphingomonas sp.]|nr:undecaprenyl-phosphate glucose phosphotransferase [Sphingomonas sp.]
MSEIDPGATTSPVVSAHGRRVPVLLELSSLLLVVIEVAVLLGAAAFSWWLILDDLNAERTRSYVGTIFLALTFFATFAELTGAYDLDARFSMRVAWSRLLMAWFVTIGFVIGAAFFLKLSATFSRAWLVAWFVTGLGGLVIARGVATIMLRSARSRGVFNQRVAIFGGSEQGWRIARHILGSSRVTIDLVGIYDDRSASRLPPPQGDVPLCGGVNQLVEDIRKGEIEQVIIALPWQEERRIQEIVTTLSLTPVRIRLAPDLVAYMFSQRAMVLLDSVPLMTLFERPISGTDQILKRVEDIVIGTIALILAAPIMLVTAIAIKLDSPGPILFKQPREGFNNKRFLIWKFRSMRTDKLEYDGINQATKHDPRVTRVGRFIRATSIDELPQFFNVLKGDMSVVGPRPHAATTKAGGREFKDVVSTYAARHRVKPGITGWAQVSGWRGETDTEDKLVRRLEHDLHYIENWSVPFDLYIIAKTAFAAVSSKAY